MLQYLPAEIYQHIFINNLALVDRAQIILVSFKFKTFIETFDKELKYLIQQYRSRLMFFNVKASLQKEFIDLILHDLMRHYKHIFIHNPISRKVINGNNNSMCNKSIYLAPLINIIYFADENCYNTITYHLLFDKSEDFNSTYLYSEDTDSSYELEMAIKTNVYNMIPFIRANKFNLPLIIKIVDEYLGSNNTIQVGIILPTNYSYRILRNILYYMRILFSYKFRTYLKEKDANHITLKIIENIGK